MSAAGPPQGANNAPWGAAQRREPQAWGDLSAAGLPQGANNVPCWAAQRREPQARGERQ
jgi:hypothetical protein